MEDQIIDFFLSFFRCPITMTIGTVIILIWVHVNMKKVDPENIAVSSVTYIDKREYWRGVTAIFTHYQVTHLLSNLYSFFCFGFLELVYGNVGYLKIITIFVVFTPLIDSLIRKIFNINRDIYCVGFSYVICGLMPVVYKNIDECKIFGFVVPCMLVPFIEIIISQIIVPYASFIAHLSGLLIGFAFYFDFFFWYSDNLFYIIFPLIVYFYFNSYIKYKKQVYAKSIPAWKRGNGRFIGH